MSVRSVVSASVMFVLTSVLRHPPAATEGLPESDTCQGLRFFGRLLVRLGARLAAEPALGVTDLPFDEGVDPAAVTGLSVVAVSSASTGSTSCPECSVNSTAGVALSTASAAAVGGRLRLTYGLEPGAGALDARRASSSSFLSS